MAKKNYPKYSVLMSVYYKEEPKFFLESIECMLKQTIKPDEFVIICDGELTPGLDEVIKKYEKNKIFKIVRLEKNVGLGPALNRGIQECSNELIVRMDSDDYSVPERVEKQLQVMMRQPQLSIIGTNVDEFCNTLEDIRGKVILPEKHEEIVKFSKRRCPFRHSALLYRKSAVLLAGNYREYYLFEDYDLYVRMIRNGALCENIQESLTYVRVSDDFYGRRGGIKYVKSIVKFKKEQLDNGFFSLKDYIISTVPHVIVCLSPNFVRSFVYRRLLRK